jgi:hypothetical protein
MGLRLVNGTGSGGIQRRILVLEAEIAGPSRRSGLLGDDRDARARAVGVERIRFDDDPRNLIARGKAAAFKPVDDELSVTISAGQGLKIREEGFFIVRQRVELLAGKRCGIQAQ